MQRVTKTVTIILAAIFISAVAYVVVKSYHDLNKPAQISQSAMKTKYEVGPPVADELLELVNAERTKAGVSPLAIDANVAMSAQLKATDMNERNYFSHIVKGTEYTLTDEMAEYVNKSCSSSGENIFWGKSTNTSQSAMDWWMNSPPHKEAIISANFSLTGFGVAGDRVVQHFCVAP